MVYKEYIKRIHSVLKRPKNISRNRRKNNKKKIRKKIKRNTKRVCCVYPSLNTEIHGCTQNLQQQNHLYFGHGTFRLSWKSFFLIRFLCFLMKNAHKNLLAINCHSTSFFSLSPQKFRTTGSMSKMQFKNISRKCTDFPKAESEIIREIKLFGF